VRARLRVPGHDLEGLYGQLDVNNSNLPRRNEIFWPNYQLGWQLGERHSRSRKLRPNVFDEDEQLLNRIEASEGLQSCSRLRCCLVAIARLRKRYRAILREVVRDTVFATEECGRRTAIFVPSPSRAVARRAIELNNRSFS
jgi:hypothetical protein